MSLESRIREKLTKMEGVAGVLAGAIGRHCQNDAGVLWMVDSAGWISDRGRIGAVRADKDVVW